MRTTFLVHESVMASTTAIATRIVARMVAPSSVVIGRHRAHRHTDAGWPRLGRACRHRIAHVASLNRCVLSTGGKCGDQLLRMRRPVQVTLCRDPSGEPLAGWYWCWLHARWRRPVDRTTRRSGSSRRMAARAPAFNSVKEERKARAFRRRAPSWGWSADRRATGAAES
jgi:hypothetical protein